MFKDFRNRMGILGELFSFLWKRKMWWMIPMVAILIVFALFVAFAGSSPLAPFIYTLF